MNELLNECSNYEIFDISTDFLFKNNVIKNKVHVAKYIIEWINYKEELKVQILLNSSSIEKYFYKKYKNMKSSLIIILI